MIPLFVFPLLDGITTTIAHRLSTLYIATLDRQDITPEDYEMNPFAAKIYRKYGYLGAAIWFLTWSLVFWFAQPYASAELAYMIIGAYIATLYFNFVSILKVYRWLKEKEGENINTTIS